ncbi:MAG: phytanoyl-CoA dioxygenase family protein [Acidimicrobiales bacterium]
MPTSEIRSAFDREGFVILPALLEPDEIRDAVADLPSEFPTADEFHSDVEPQRNARFRDEFGGITSFPAGSTPLNLLSVHPRLIDLAAVLLGDDDLRSYSIEFWAKYTEAADYDQPLHRDYLNHSVLVPAADAPPSQVEMFVYLSDVTEDLGPIALLPRRHAPDPPALPNWYPAVSGQRDEEHPDWVARDGHPDWYEHEVTATGPAGTVIAYRIDTFHRGTNLVAHGGHRFTIHTNFRKASDDWITRRAWTDRANRGSAWSDFVTAASPDQLRLFGIPPPGHSYWTDTTLDGVAQRYPGVNPEPWR